MLLSEILMSVRTQDDFIIGLSLLVIGLLLASITGFFMGWLSRKSRRTTFKTSRQENGWGDFIKKNFPLFLVLFFVIMAITGLAMMI